MPLTDAQRIAAAALYINALATHRGDDVPFAPECVRYELGIKTGRSGDHLRRSLNNGPQFKLIREVSTPEFTVDGDRIRAVFELATKPSLFGRCVGARVDETFLIPADAATAQIHHIDASIRPTITK